MVRLQRKARRLSSSHKFKASSYWVQSFVKRHPWVKESLYNVGGAPVEESSSDSSCWFLWCWYWKTNEFLKIYWTSWGDFPLHTGIEGDFFVFWFSYFFCSLPDRFFFPFSDRKTPFKNEEKTLESLTKLKSTSFTQNLLTMRRPNRYNKIDR